MSAAVCVPGRLGFTSQHVFNRLGRALLVPIFLQARSRNSNIGPFLKMALVWWRTTLQDSMCEVRDASVCAGRAVLQRSLLCRCAHGNRSGPNPCTFCAMRGGSTPVHAVRETTFCSCMPQVHSTTSGCSSLGRRWQDKLHGLCAASRNTRAVPHAQ